MDVLIALYLFLIGAIFGSYVVAVVWRLRAKELKLSGLKKNNSSVGDEYKKIVINNKLAESKFSNDFSRCLHCQHKLKWYDLIPIFSWLTLKGKCRYCKQPIGQTEIMAEIVLGMIFAISYLLLKDMIWWPLLILWLILMIVGAVLFIYDLKWQVLPTSVLWLGIVIGVVFAIINIYIQMKMGVSIISIVRHYFMSWVVLSGLYMFLAKFSKEQWVGSGDAYVGAIMALVLGNWTLAVISLFLANFLGCVVVFAKMLILHQNVHRMRIAFAPMLLSALVIIYTLQFLLVEKIFWLGFDV